MAMMPTVWAAEIFVLPDRVQGYEVIVIRGEIAKFDEEHFDDVALQVEKGLILLDSPGGDVWAGISIGKSVRLRKYLTGVAENSTCASACGFIWLAGNERLVFPGGRVGFHAAYRVDSGRAIESGSANAVIGAYLNQIGMNYQSISWLTQAGPETMRWLTQQTAIDLGINVYFLPGSEGNESIAESSEPTPPAVNESKNFNSIRDRDIFGFDMGEGLKSSSASSCEALCSTTSGCRAYSYNRSKKQCFLKSGGKHVFWNKDVTGGFKSLIRDDLEFLRIVIVNSTALEGKTYQKLQGVLIENCAKQCHDAGRCTGFEYVKNPDQQCWLKEGNLRKLKKARQTAGIKTAE